jgi:hypothetical protein
VKRILACVLLVLVSVGGLWVAHDRLNPTPPPAHKGAANSANAENLGRGAVSGLATVGAANSGSAGLGSAINSPSTMTTLPTTANFLSCQTKCQTGGSSCQSECYQRYNVTNQTQYWNQCMQTCGAQSSVCSNNCVSGTTLPPISTVLPSPPPAPPSQPLTRPPPPAQRDEPSSSSSSARPPSSSTDQTSTAPPLTSQSNQPPSLPSQRPSH